MSKQTWAGGAKYHPLPPRIWHRIRAALRAIALVILIGFGLFVLLGLRAIERPLFAQRRPWTPWITQTVCRGALWIFALEYQIQGRASATCGAVVANHGSWLDIFVLNAAQQVYFVSKAEVAKWPGIGLLARATGTVFIQRDRREAREQTRIFENRLGAGHKLLFFPEGTSSDTLRVLPFKPTLFAAFFSPAFVKDICVQPVSLRYQAPQGEDPRFYGWWGDMGFGPHLWQVLCAPRQGRILVVFHEPIAVRSHETRKTLAATCEAVIQSGFDDSSNRFDQQLPDSGSIHKA
ncbi:1-acyl-sn-glycerol-3-phosphate acyltransferase [Rhodobacteraceae bacterium]|nr:1-acyl-sn-glycerol-3-phosphate acyltransferase [Paracoccaceae bacterium]